MKPLERPTHRFTFRAGITVLAVLAVLALLSTSSRRSAPGVLAASVVVVATAAVAAAENETAIRAFRVDVSDEPLTDLRRRLLVTRRPDKKTVTDRSQGIQLEKLQALVRYWGTSCDWRKAEAKLGDRADNAGFRPLAAPHDPSFGWRACHV